MALKTLIAVTCVAVLAYIGYFFYREAVAYGGAREAAAAQARIERDARCASAARELADAKAGRLTTRASQPFAVLEAIVRGCANAPPG